MTFRSVLATNCMLVGWMCILLLTFSAATLAVGPWPNGLPEVWFFEFGLLAAACIVAGLLLRISRRAEKGYNSHYMLFSSDVADSVAEVRRIGAQQRLGGLLGLVWLP